MKTVLVVDDEPRTLEVLRVALESNGYRVETAVNSTEAEQKANSLLPDMVILDIMLPPSWNEEGIAVCRNLKNNDNTRHIPIIMITLRGEDEIRHKCSEAGADGFINKIFSISDLLKEIEKVFQKSRENDTTGKAIGNPFAILRLSITGLLEA